MNFYIHQEITHKETGEKFTVRSRDYINGILCVSLMEREPNDWYESSLFEASDVVKTFAGWAFSIETDFNTHTEAEVNNTIPYCIVERMNDKALVNEWRESVENEEFESSQVLWDEMVERNIN